MRASSCDHATGGEVLEGGSDRRWLGDKGQREEGVQICLRSFAVRGGNEGIWKQCIVFSAYSDRCSAGDYDHSEARMEGVAADNPQEGAPADLTVTMLARALPHGWAAQEHKLGIS